MYPRAMDVQSPSIRLHNHNRHRNLNSNPHHNPICTLASPNRTPNNNPYHNR